MSKPAITYETVELRCLCGELTVCVARGPVNIAEFLHSAIDLGWRQVDSDRMEVATFWDGEVQVRLSGVCAECVTRAAEGRVKRAA
jgi:hypothetical protein